MSSSPPQLADLLAHHSQLQQHVAARLRCVEEELRLLDSLRTAVAELAPRVGVEKVKVQTVPVSGSHKRRRGEDGDLCVGYLATHRLPTQRSAAKALDAFRDAGLYRSSDRNCVRVAPVDRSQDEKELDNLRRLYPSECVWRDCGGQQRVGEKHMPARGEERVRRSLAAAGLRANDFALGERQTSRGYLVVTCAAPRQLCANLVDPSSLSEDYLQLQRLAHFSDPITLYTTLQAALIERALQDALPSTTGVVAARLLTVADRTVTMQDSSTEAFELACACEDADLVEASYVQWCKTLLYCRPSPFPQVAAAEREFYGKVWHALFRALAACSKARQRSLRWVASAHLCFPPVPSE